MIVSIGIDIVEVRRVESAIGRHGARFLEKIYTAAEIAYCETKAARFIHYAGRFAAKEAAMKALGTGWGQGVAWRDVEIVASPGGPPRLVLGGIAGERGAALGVARSHLSISHTHEHAVAQVVLESA
jgi:holo-[acyl-carrier protein] synthase